MAVGLFKLSHKQRRLLAIIFIVLNALEILCGVTITGTSVYVFVSVSPVMQSEKDEINFVIVVYGIFGMDIIFNWIIGMKICSKCVSQAQKKSTRSLLLLWYCAGTNSVIALIIIVQMSKKVNKHVSKSMKNSLQKGIDNYLSDVTWKEYIDEIQYNMGCCGVESYEDWYEETWMNKYVVDENSALVKELRTSQDELKLPVVPWSCCKVDFPMQCLHDPIQQVEYTHMWADEPEVVKDSINADGCMGKLKKPLGIVISGFSSITAVVTILHVVIMLISRIVYTSYRNAILLNDPDGVAPGWIFGRGDCGYARGKTLGQIMGIKEPLSVPKRRRSKISPEEDSSLLLQNL